MHVPQRLLVIVVFGEHRTDHGDIIGELGGVRQNLGIRDAALTGRPKLERRSEEIAVPRNFHQAGEGLRQRLAVLPIQFRLGIEQVHVARPAVLE